MKKEILILATLFFSFLSYPAIAIDKGAPETQDSAPTEGWVKLSFEISETGKTENIQVIESSPAGYFDAEAIKALASWKYKPKVVNGTSVRQFDQFVQLDFAIEEDGN
ncbi:energy transducer TonB [Alteromonas sp. ALT199]|uniref:energy transducer TonB n=1 Tax=unclassified Alteromonas TaxID=2614992 RepID=UPI001BEB2E70|nr:energy transducer TonB [Alteromonas sp. ALT199]MBT3137218.1 energy transducer TonB [Alteromonas sp. ALT199]